MVATHFSRPFLCVSIYDIYIYIFYAKHAHCCLSPTIFMPSVVRRPPLIQPTHPIHQMLIAKIQPSDRLQSVLFALAKPKLFKRQQFLAPLTYSMATRHVYHFGDDIFNEYEYEWKYVVDTANVDSAADSADSTADATVVAISDLCRHSFSSSKFYVCFCTGIVTMRKWKYK